jgi:DNA-binding transcriptional LysR family regulator
MRFDPEHLRVFSALLAEGSAARASLELRTSRSNVRRVWHHLEKQIGERLFTDREEGGIEATAAGRRLEREMTRLQEQVRRFESRVRKMHRDGRVLRLGADRHLFNTGHFGRAFQTLRGDPRLRIAFVEVTSADSRSALESGACDLLFSVDGIPGRRVESRELPPMPLEVACAGTPPASSPLPPAELSRRCWSLAELAGTPRAMATLQWLRSSGGGEGRLCSQHHFLRWAEDTTMDETDAIVCVKPMSHHRLPQVTFVPLGMDAGYPLSVSCLRQHPYEFLPALIEQVNRALAAPADGLRPGDA